MVYFMQPFIIMNFVNYALREKCPNTEFFLVRIFLYSVQIQENTEQKNICIWTLFMQWQFITIFWIEALFLFEKLAINASKLSIQVYSQYIEKPATVYTYEI